MSPDNGLFWSKAWNTIFHEPTQVDRARGINWRHINLLNPIHTGLPRLTKAELNNFTLGPYTVDGADSTTTSIQVC